VRGILRGTADSTHSPETAAPLLVLGPSLGTTADPWRAVAELLADRFRIVRLDLPGHGVAPAADSGFSVQELAEAVLAVVDSMGGGRFSYAGVSLGGAIGIELALGAGADRLDGLAVLCSDARIGEPDGWLARAEQVRRQGTASMVAGSSARWFAPDFLVREPDLGGRMLSALVDVDDESYALCCEALAGFDRREDVGAIAVPVLIVAGDSDPVVPPIAAQALGAAIQGARTVVLEGTGHQAHVERPAEVAALLAELLPGSRYDKGIDVRRQVLGDDWVDESLRRLTPETEDFQRFITEYAWGGIWTRPGLDRRMRSAVTISSLVTAHHWHELELHLHAALRNGLSREEISEILLQTTIYAGAPAANSAFGVARRVFAEHDDAPHDDED